MVKKEYTHAYSVHFVCVFFSLLRNFGPWFVLNDFGFSLHDCTFAAFHLLDFYSVVVIKQFICTNFLGILANGFSDILKQSLKLCEALNATKINWLQTTISDLQRAYLTNL